LTRLRTLLSGGLAATASLWTPVEAAYDWVFRAAAILANVAGLSGAAVKASYRGLVGVSPDIKLCRINPDIEFVRRNPHTEFSLAARSGAITPPGLH
jgi:hypothetical protein